MSIPHSAPPKAALPVSALERALTNFIRQSRRALFSQIECGSSVMTGTAFEPCVGLISDMTD